MLKAKEFLEAMAASAKERQLSTAPTNDVGLVSLSLH